MPNSKKINAKCFNIANILEATDAGGKGAQIVVKRTDVISK